MRVRAAKTSGGLNLYGFVGNDPVNGVDPFGFTWLVFDGEAWGQLGSDTLDSALGWLGDKLLGKRTPTKFDPNSYAAQRGIDDEFVNSETGERRRGTGVIKEMAKEGVKEAFNSGTGKALGATVGVVAKCTGRKLPNKELLAAPPKRGNAPIGSDGKPVELHHRNQNPDSELDEMTRTDHRGKDNFKKNHENTGQHPSEIDRSEWKTQRSNIGDSSGIAGVLMM